MIRKVIDWIFITAGFAICLSTLIDALQGYVLLPTRYEGTFTVYAAQNPGIFWGMLCAWILGGGFLMWLGWVEVRRRLKGSKR